MTRTIPLSLHSALELIGGFAVLVGPFLIGAEPAAQVAGVCLGAMLVGLALAGPEALTLAAHQAFDLALVAALGAGGLGLALTGDAAGGLWLAGAGAFELLLAATTRWSRV